MQKTLLHPEVGRFFYDSEKCAKGELARLHERGYVDQPPELVDTPVEVIDWGTGTPVSVDTEERKTVENARKARAINERYMFDLLDKIANWLATENEFTIPADLKSFVSAWQGRKPKKN